MRVLAGDVGGTHTRLALVETDGESVEVLDERVFASGKHQSLAELVVASGTVAGCVTACFGVPGPVIDQRCRTTNLPWVVEAPELAARTGLARVWLLNDLEAAAHGVSALTPADCRVLNPGRAGAVGNRAVLAAGTGLGEAGLLWDGARHLPVPGEGGHADFAPADAFGYALADHLGERYGHVSWERVVSGPGLVDLYRFVLRWHAADESPAIARRMREDDPAAVVAEAALAGDCALCAEALSRFVRYLGAEAGNLALRSMALGGVYLAGGVAPKILPFLEASAFRQAFTAKGRFSTFLESVPVRVVTNLRLALLGAARHAARKLQ